MISLLSYVALERARQPERKMRAHMCGYILSHAESKTGRVGGGQGLQQRKWTSRVPNFLGFLKLVITALGEATNL